MQRILFLAFFAFAFEHAISQGSAGISALLFNGVKTRLTAAEKKQIADNLGFVLSGNKDQPFAQDKDSREFPFAAQVYPTDLNKDGKEEIFVLFGNSYTSGGAGSSIVVYIRNAAGKYEANLGFPGTLPEALTTVNQGYPDLLIGGPGFDFPVWRWNGKTYDHYKTVNEKTYNALKKTDVGNVSAAYQGTLK